MDLNKFIDDKIKSHGDFQSFIADSEIGSEFFEQVEEETNINDYKNVLLFKRYLTKSGNLGLHCRIGGDQEDPADVILFIKQDGEAWLKTIHEGGDKPRLRKGSPSASKIERTVEMIAESPTGEGCKRLGSLTLFNANNTHS